MMMNENPSEIVTDPPAADETPAEEVKTKGRSKIIYILLGVIIIAELLWTSYVYVFQKDGTHSDEIWSYGLANSYELPFVFLRPGIHVDFAERSDYRNVGEWISSDVLRNYVTVQAGQRFSYGSVWDNQKYDHHPPLYYLLLHTICSFFPDTFSWGFGYFMNCCFLILTQIFLFKSSRIILKDDRYALVTCFFYGAGHAALYTFSFVRQYSMLTMFTVIMIYLIARLFEDPVLKKRLPPILIVSMLMFLTHYYALVFAGTMTACICIWFCFHKQLTKMLIYGFSMLGCLGLYFLIFPASLEHMFNYSTYETKIFGTVPQLRKLLNYITSNQLGFNTSIYESYIWRVLPVVLLVLVLLLAPLCFLFRKEKWFIKVKNTAAAQPGRFLRWLRTANWIPVMLVLSCFMVVFAVNLETDLYYMGFYATRYIFCVFPPVCIIVMSLTITLLRQLPFIKKHILPIITVAAVVITGKINLFKVNNFLFENYPRGSDLADLTAGKNCVVIAPERFEWSLTTLCDTFLDAKNIYLVTPTVIREGTDNIKDLGEPVDCILTAYPSLTDEDFELLTSWGAEVPEDIVLYNMQYANENETMELSPYQTAIEFQNEVAGDRETVIRGQFDVMNSTAYFFDLR